MISAAGSVAREQHERAVKQLLGRDGREGLGQPRRGARRVVAYHDRLQQSLGARGGPGGETADLNDPDLGLLGGGEGKTCPWVLRAPAAARRTRSHRPNARQPAELRSSSPPLRSRWGQGIVGTENRSKRRRRPATRRTPAAAVALRSQSSSVARPGSGFCVCSRLAEDSTPLR
jgi:hypothetical protein